MYGFIFKHNPFIKHLYMTIKIFNDRANMVKEGMRQFFKNLVGTVQSGGGVMNWP
jgi:hypothetical protein